MKIIAVLSMVVVLVSPSPRYYASAAWSPDGDLIAIGSATIPCDPDMTDEVQIVDAVTYEPMMILGGVECGVTSVDWSPDGTKILASSIDFIGLYIWDVVTGQQLLEDFQSGGLSAAKWSPDGTKIAASGVFGLVNIYDSLTGELIERHDGIAFAWSPAGDQLAVAGGPRFSSLFILDANGEPLEEFDQLPDLYQVAWSPDGEKLAINQDSDLIRIWDATTFELIDTLDEATGERIYDLAWSPDSRYLASTNEAGSIRVWDVIARESEEVAQLKTYSATLDWNGTQLLYAHYDGGMPVVVSLLDKEKNLWNTPD